MKNLQFSVIGYGRRLQCSGCITGKIILLDSMATEISNRNVVLEKDDEKIMGRSRNQRGSLVKSWTRLEDDEMEVYGRQRS